LAIAAKRRSNLGRYLNFAFWQAKREVIARIWKLGIPIAATYGSEAGFFSALTLLVGTLGVKALAAQTIVNQVIYIVFMVSSGISYAVSIHISEACSQAQFARARRLNYSGLALGLAAMAMLAVPYLMIPGTIVGLFMRTPPGLQSGTGELAAGGLAIAALLQIFDCSQSLASGALRGTGDTTSPFKLSLIGYWAIGLPAAYGLGVALPLGIYGIWSGLTLGLAVTAVLLIVAFETRVGRLKCALLG
jgi:MATE family multidrug resistance protein